MKKKGYPHLEEEKTKEDEEEEEALSITCLGLELAVANWAASLSRPVPPYVVSAPELANTESGHLGPSAVACAN